MFENCPEIKAIIDSIRDTNPKFYEELQEEYDAAKKLSKPQLREYVAKVEELAEKNNNPTFNIMANFLSLVRDFT